MASVANDPNGRRRIQFIGLDGKRKTLRLGKLPKRDAESVCRHVENILTSAAALQPLPRDTAEWLGELVPPMYSKLVSVGLVTPREEESRDTLGDFLDAYLARRTDAKASTHLFYGHTARNLKSFFGETRSLASISPAECDDFRRWLATSEKLSPATVARRCSLARTFFRDALRRRMIDSNPFEDIGGGPKSNPDRQQFIDLPTIRKVIDACPNAAWRGLLALSRFGGLRVPSEAIILRWEDIHWDSDRMTIRSPKTEHHVGKASRVCPLFPELRPYLEDLHALAPKGAVYVLEALRPLGADRGNWAGMNFRTQLERIISRAGVVPWPKLWHNLRSSRQTELTEEFPAHVVSAWLGNSERIAAQHYLQVLDSHFAKATQNPTQTASELRRFDAHGETGKAKTPCFQGVPHSQVGDTGLEPVTSTL